MDIRCKLLNLQFTIYVRFKVKQAHSTLEPKNLYLSYFEFEVTSSVIVGLNAFLRSPNLPDEGLSGMPWKFFWHNGQTH